MNDKTDILAMFLVIFRKEPPSQVPDIQKPKQ